MTDKQRRTNAGRARGGEELDGAEALLLLLGEQRTCSSLSRVPATTANAMLALLHNRVFVPFTLSLPDWAPMAQQVHQNEPRRPKGRGTNQFQVFRESAMAPLNGTQQERLTR